jgi:hypothetical protein
VREPGKSVPSDFVSVLGGRVRNQQEDVQIPAPDDVEAARGLRARLGQSLPWDVTIALFVNGVESSTVKCEITAPDLACDALAGSQPVAAGDLLALGITSEGKSKGKGKGKGASPTINFSLVLE